MMGLSVSTDERKPPLNAKFERQIIQAAKTQTNNSTDIIQRQQQIGDAVSTQSNGTDYSAGEWTNNGTQTEIADARKVKYGQGSAQLSATPATINIDLDNTTTSYTINNLPSIENITYNYKGKTADTYTTQYSQPQTRKIYRSGDTLITITTYSPQISQTSTIQTTTDEVSAEICVKSGYYNGDKYVVGQKKPNSEITTKGNTITKFGAKTYTNPKAATVSGNNIAWTTTGTGDNIRYICTEKTVNSNKVEVTDADEIAKSGIINTQTIKINGDGVIENSAKNAENIDVTTKSDTTYSTPVKDN